MNIEIANRLFELRKKKNLSQEDLADKIGVSRQAVSKWERAESAPDTSNLIELAKLYEVSLDELLFTTESTKGEKQEEKKEFVSIGLDGIHVIEKDGSEVHVGFKGIQVKNKSNPDFDESLGQSWDEVKENFKNRLAHKLPIPILVAIVYVVIGFYYNLWHPGWLIFFAVPIYYETVEMFFARNLRKKLNLFPMALLCAAAYLIAGLCYS